MHRNFSFAIARLQLFQHPENVKISIFPITQPGRKRKRQKHLTNFLKLFFAQRWGRWPLWLKISSAQIFWFCKSNVRAFATSRKCKNFNLSLYIVPAEMLYLQKYLIIIKNFFCLQDEERGYCGWKFEVHRHFSFAIATFQLFQHPENVKISIFPITLSRQKCYIFKSI